MWLGLLLISGFLAWLLQYMLFRKNWHKGLNVRVRFSYPNIFEGESSTLEETVTNDKRLPVLAVSVRLAFDRNLEFVKASKENTGISDQTYKRDIFSLLPKQKIRRKLSFVGKKRGYYTIKNADVSGYDYFLNKGYYTSFPQDAYLYVYPKLIDTSRIRLISRSISGMMISKSKLYPDPFEFSGIREYRKEDPMNRINWKASARTGELMVNQFDSTTEYNVTILLDLEDSYIMKYEELIEESIRICAGLCAQLLQAKMPVRVIANGEIRTEDSITEKSSSEDSILRMEFSSTSGNVTPLLQALACIDTSQVRISMPEVIARELEAYKEEKIYVVISKNHHPELTSAFYRILEAGNQLLWVCPVMSYDMDKKYEDEKINIIHWEVEL